MLRATCVILSGLCLSLLAAAPEPPLEERLARLRNLGKAFYENPTTQTEAVEEFRKALALSPDSARERLNYGLALIKAGKTQEGIAELEKVQGQDPKLPHTYFNLGIQLKKLGENERAIAQFRKMIELVPSEPISHYNLAALYKLTGNTEGAAKEFETAASLDSNLAAPHFQLYNLYRISQRKEDAKRELALFQRMKKAQEGAPIPEDVEWSSWAEIYDIMSDTPGEDKPATLKFVKSDARLPALSGASGDFNNDGQQDLCVLTATGAELYAGRAGKYVKQAIQLPPGPYNKAVWLDFDHDYDLDLVLLGKKSVLLRNQGAAGFVPVEFPFVEGEAVDAAVFRLMADTKGLDLLVSYRDREGVLYVDKLGGKYEARPVKLPAGARQLLASDLTNDGWIDVVYAAGQDVSLLHNIQGELTPEVIASGKAAGALAAADLENRGLEDVLTGETLLRNLGGGKFAVKSSPVPSCKSIETLDQDHDGRADIACDGQIFFNRTESANKWIGVKLAGVKNLKLAANSEVEVKAGPRYQKKIYRGDALLFGLGSETSADTVRTTWANGLIQNEMKQAAGKTHAYEEAQRLSGSCPMIWTWNGKEFEYITDVLGVAPLGAASGDGGYFPVDHDEYIQIPGEKLKPVDGKYEIRITEELSEVAYLDQVKLIAVDHPAAEEVFTNDKFKSPPFPEFRLFGVRRRIPPVSATDERGANVLERALRKDRTYPDSFRRTLSGIGDAHSLTLDFGREAARSNRAILVLSGWVDWADGSTFLAAAQESRSGLVTPSLQVRDQQGRWRTVIEDMGMPAGKPKTIVVDLTGKFLSASREVRIVTNLCVYWDEIFLSEDSGAKVRQTEVQPSEASLRFRGFSPVVIHPDRKQPEQFSYANAKPFSMWNPTPGLYTRYGDVAELTAQVDDKFVVMGSGDELRLRFGAGTLPPLPSGWKRDFLLLVDGWAKDRDANTAFSQSTDPLPFHGMSRFPYPEGERYPDDPEHEQYRKTYNTRPALRLIRPLAQR